MNKKVIYIGVGAVVAYLLYKKFVAKPEEKSTEAEEATEETSAEETPSAGGGGGGGGAAAPSAATAVKKSTQLTPASKLPTKIGKPMNPMYKKRTSASLRPMMVKGQMSPSMKPPVPVATAPKIAVAPVTKFAGFMDFDANDDVLGSMM